MHKHQIVEAIQNQEWLQITFHREKDDAYVTRIVAPYDIFPQESGNREGENRLLGYTKAHEDYRPGIISLYLNDIRSITNTGEQFDGVAIRGLIRPKRLPYIPRNW